MNRSRDTKEPADAVGTRAGSRRDFLHTATFGAAAAGLLAVPGLSVIAEPSKECGDAFQSRREAAEAFLRSYYASKDGLDIDSLVLHWAETGIRFEDHVLGVDCAPLTDRNGIRLSFGGLFTAVGTPGRFSKFFHATGDLNYGVISEFVDVPGTFFARGFDLMTVNVLTGGLISHYIDHWDSWQLAENDITGSGDTTTTPDPFSPTGPKNSVPVALQLAPVHANGVPRFSTPCSPPIPSPNSASAELVQYVNRLHDALSKGDSGAVAALFTENCLFIHPLLHRGLPGYGTFCGGIQVRGRNAVASILKSAVHLLPDGENSILERVIGSLAGGGYQWRSGGIYASQGLTRQGILGATALDFSGNQISRMSVKFDTFHLTQDQRSAIQDALDQTCLSTEENL
jgi:hypothetical protein